MMEHHIPVDTLEAEIFRVTSRENRGCLFCERVEYRGMFGDNFVGFVEVEDFPGAFRDEPRFFAQYNTEDTSIDVFTVANDGGTGVYIETFYLFV